MDLNQVRYFTHLAETLNFTQAARLSGVSQPSLTRAIQRLEEELGGPLLYRDGKDTRLTPLGRDVEARFTAIAHSLEEVREASENAVQGKRRLVNIGVDNTIPPTGFAPFLRQALAELPGVFIEIYPLARGEGVAELLSGRFDACILSGAPAVHPKLAVLALYRERFAVGCAADHPFARRKTIEPAELGHEVYIDRLACEFRSQIVAYFMDRDILMRPRFSAEREDWVQRMVAVGAGICILPERSAFLPDVVARPVAGMDLARDVVLATVSGSGTPREVREIVRLAQRFDWASPDASKL